MKIKWTWKKIILTLSTLCGIGVLTSCYGMPPGEEPVYIDDTDSVEEVDTSESQDGDLQNEEESE